MRDPDSTTYVGAIEPIEAFGRRLRAAAVRRGLQQATTVIVLGDGAPWIWNRAEDFPGAVQIVDLYHAREHLAIVARLAFGGTETGTAWIAATSGRPRGRRYRSHRGRGSASWPAAIARCARRYARRPSTSTPTRCACATSAFGPAASSSAGVVEAGCKTVIGQRLKQSGMRWTVVGANAVIALRCRLLGNRWEDLWRLVA